MSATKAPVDAQVDDAVTDLVSDTSRHELMYSKPEQVAITGEHSLVDQVAMFEHAIELWGRKMSLLEMMRRRAIRMTNPQDWVLMKARGAEIATAFPRASACSKIRQVWGIDVMNVRPTNQDGGVEPKVTEDESGQKTYTVWGGALARHTGDAIERIEASRSTAEKFIGREGSVPDMRSACVTLLLSKAARVISGLTNVPQDELDASWEGTTKSSKYCNLGSGFGSASDRAATRVADEGVPEAAKKLGEDILRAVGGDTGAARDLLRELTSDTKKDGTVFAGFDSVSRFTLEWQVKKARKKFDEHPTFGGGS